MKIRKIILKKITFWTCKEHKYWNKNENVNTKTSGNFGKPTECFARKIGLSRSEIVRRALLEYFKRDEKKNSISFLDLSQDIAGSIDGPPDLATNKVHFEGYGK